MAMALFVTVRRTMLLLRRRPQSCSRRWLVQRARALSNLVELRLEDDVAVITLSNPSKLNALTVAMGQEFEQVVDTIATSREDIRAVVLTGAGKGFSAGGDINWLMERHAAEPHHNVDTMRRFYSMYLSVRRIPVPVISAINGAAVGAGLCLTLATDIRVAAKEAKLGFSFVHLGLHPGMAGTFFLPKVVPQQVANRLLLTGEVITGEEAARIGLVAEAVPQGEVVERAMGWARQIAKASPVAVRATVKTLRSAQEAGLDQALQREADAQATCYRSADYKEGVTAVAAKRGPTFQGFHDE